MTHETHAYEDVQVGAGVEEDEVQAAACAGVVEVQSSAGGNKHPRVPRPNAKRQKNFIPNEDEIVVSAWLNVSKDPVQGANQSHSSFWRRIYDYYETHRKSFASRTESSLMHRWMYILENVNKYCSCYDAIDHRNQSGKTIQDKDEEKWKAKRRELAELKQACNKKKKVRLDSTPTNVQVNITEDVTEIAPPESEA
ncbi:glutathione S-transferase T2-like [Miscanthus floridulus]|uniref:glutathione S-transferase T2-like n=1 Tax=Miscanthus floridulus TaxID=154761 RepID=UPI00345A8310